MNMEMEKYKQYKESNIIWLNEIPYNWEILPAKRKSKVLKELNTSRQCDNVLSLTLRGVVNNNLDNPEGLVPKDYGTYQLFRKNDLVFKLIDLENVSTSRVGLVHEDGIMSSAYIRLICGSSIHPKYAYYFYYSLYKNEVYNKLGSGVRSTLGPNDLLNLPILLPNLSDQKNIANFLDEKTTKIDQAITQKERLIELLQERKQVIIQNAVTKGLNPKVQLKDSGVEWIGEIPEHWECKKLKFILNERNERSLTGCEPLFMMSQLYGLVLRSDYHEKAEVAESNVGNKMVYKNDLVFNKLKAHLGVFFKSEIEFTGLVSPDYAVYYANDLIEDVKFLELLFRHPIYIEQFIIRATGIVEGLIRLYTDDLFDLYIPLPPNKEQMEILEELQRIVNRYEQLVLKEQTQIQKLKEYKTSLIDSAVTGKIKVATN